MYDGCPILLPPDSTIRVTGILTSTRSYRRGATLESRATRPLLKKVLNANPRLPYNHFGVKSSEDKRDSWRVQHNVSARTTTGHKNF
jgi:hypothetical protein